MNDLAALSCGGALPVTAEPALREIENLEAWMLQLPQEEIETSHLFHAGMYTRTIRMPKGVVLTGARMKRATVVIVAGRALMLAGDTWAELEGYNVLPGSAGRKQVFVSLSEVFITMVFPTGAKTVEAAEAEFTEDAERLLSRRQNVNRAIWTGE